MERLVRLIEALNKSETALLLNHYKYYYNGANRKRLHLFTLIKNGIVKSDEEAADRILNCKPNANYAQLKKRLKDDMVNILLHQDSTDKSTNFNVQATLECRKYLSAGELLMKRGAYKPGVEILKKALKISEKFELYPERIQISKLLCSHLGRTSAKEFFTYLDIIEDSYEKLDDHIKAYTTNFEIMQPARFSAKRKQLNTEYVSQRIEYLKKLFEKTDSPKIGVDYYKALINQLIESDQKKALSAAEEFMDLITNNPSVYVQSTVAGIHYMMSGIYTNMENYDQGEFHAREAVNNFKRGFMNELSSMDSLFRNLLFKDELEESLVICENALKHRQLNTVQDMKAKWLYFKANVFFKLERYDETWDILQRNSKLLKDRSGWLLGHKLLELLTLIEQGEIELFSFRNENFGRLLRSIKTDNIDRYKVIHKVLKTLFQHGFEFQSAYKDTSDLIENLRSKNSKLQWEANSFELCRFEFWFESNVDLPIKQL
ncbi:MAG: hypothetical protein HKN92_10445 [Chitinophagales bacterium]|nr:hypothetical protein [Chitinophagales bacterium]